MFLGLIWVKKKNIKHIIRNVNLFFIQCKLIEMKVKFAISKTRIYVINETKSLLETLT